MKKLMFAAAAIAAGVAMADVSSANVVGYQNFDTKGQISYGDFNYVAPTFLPVSGGKVRLGDIKLENVSSGASTIQFFNAGGASAQVTKDMIGDEAFAEYEGSDALFLYYTEDDADTYGGEPGWYLGDDWESSLFLMDDVKIGVGQSFVLDAGDKNMKITFSGEVNPGDEGEISMPFSYGDFNFLGNVTPSHITLGDIALCNVSSGASTIQFFNAGGASAQVTKDLIGEEAFAEYEGSDALFLYYTEDDAETYGGEPGWYLADDWESSLFLMNDVPILSGQGFVLDAGDKNMTIQIPAAIQPAIK